MSLITLSPAFAMKLPIGQMQVIGPTPTGDKAYIRIRAGGKMTLPDGTLAATFSEGSNFTTLNADGFGKLDVRITAKTVDTDELLYIAYFGHIEANDAIKKVLTAAPDARSTTIDDGKVFISMTIETGAKNFAWMNRTIFVGRARFDVEPDGNSIVYEVLKATA